MGKSMDTGEIPEILKLETIITKKGQASTLTSTQQEEVKSSVMLQS